MPLRLPLALAELLVGWLLLTSLGGRGDPWPVVGLVVVGASAYVLGHAVPRPARPYVAGALGALVLGAVLLGSGRIDFVLAGPLGYANANAALAVQGGAALGLVASAPTRWSRYVGLAGALLALVTAMLVGAVAATAGGALVCVAVALPRGRGQRVSVVLSATVLVATSLLAFVIGAVGVDDAGSDALTGRRVALWTDAVNALDDEPILGVGARRFPSASPTAASDADTREAHAELLQRAVENGVPGLLLEGAAVALVAGSLTRRAWTGGPGATPSVVGLAGLAALWANAGVDYVLAFPAVVAVGWAVAGLASAEPRWRRFWRPRVTSSERPNSST